MELKIITYRKRHHEVVLVVSCAVMDHQCVQKWTEHTAMVGTSIQGDGGGSVVFDPDTLWPAGQQIQDTVAHR